MSKKIVMLCSDCFSTVVLYNDLVKHYPIDKIIVEEPLRGLALAKRRVKKLGIVKVAGQVMFSAGIAPLLRISSKSRLNQIIGNYNFDQAKLPDAPRINVPTVNNPACIEILQRLSPDIVIVNGTRIISKKVLDSVNAIFINMHTGITPQYRGVHGGYWAVVNNDLENFGVTVHLVDKGIDTGGVIGQARIRPTGKDNFSTYPYLQFGEGIPIVREAINSFIKGELHTIAVQGDRSQLWYHPTIWQYLYQRIFRNKK